MNFNTYDEYTFGKCIKIRREERGLSIRTVSKFLEISPTYLNDIEKGSRKAPKKELMQKIINVLEIPDYQIEDLFDMAFVSRGYSEEINIYLSNNIYARKAIRLAKELQLSDEEWKEIIVKLEEKKSRI